MSKRKKWDSASRNNRTYIQYYNRLVELAISMFEWKNMPPNIDIRYLELKLFYDGVAVFFKDEELDEFLALPTMLNGNLDNYGIARNRTAYASNGYQNKLTDKDSVLVFNNYLHTNSVLDIQNYAERLYELERTIDVNVKAQKTPIIIQCSENQRLIMKNLLMQYEGNEPFIYGDKDLDLKGIKVLNTQAPYVADNLNTLKREVFNEALTYLGISNVNIQKKERLLADEITRNMGSIEAQKFTRLNARKEACKKINEMFGLDVDVEYREDIKMLEGVVEERGKENE